MTDKIIMPKELTAENGAKALLMGEFAERVNQHCPECGGDNDSCVACNGTGYVTVWVRVQWDTIKKIYKMAAQHLGEPEVENARLRTALHDAIRRPTGVVPDSAVEFYDIKVCPDCGEAVTWYHDAEGVSRAVCKDKCKGWKVLREIDRSGRE